MQQMQTSPARNASRAAGSPLPARPEPTPAKPAREAPLALKPNKVPC